MPRNRVAEPYFEGTVKATRLKRVTDASISASGGPGGLSGFESRDGRREQTICRLQAVQDFLEGETLIETLPVNTDALTPLYTKG